MAESHTGNRQPEIDAEEHDTKNLHVKKSALIGYLVDSDEYVRLSAVESSESPGYYGLLVLNADGSAVSTGGSSDPATSLSNLLLQGGDDMLLQSGDFLLTQA